MHFIGMRRSGSHAIINWLQKNAFSDTDKGTAIHFNDVFAPYAVPPRRLRPRDISITSPSSNVLTLLSYEDLPLALIPKLPTVVSEDTILSDSTKHKFLLLRDPFNAFASRLQRLRTAEKEGFVIAMQKQDWPEIAELWKSYAREYLGRTNLIGDKVGFSYNKWFADKGYRDDLLRDHFGREENLDIGIDEVSPHARGSSFDGLSYAGRGREMDTQGRWRHFSNDDFYRNLFRDRELVSLSQEIFGNISGTEQLYGNFGSKERR